MKWSATTLVVMIQHLPQSGLRTVVEVLRRDEHVAQVRCLERLDVGLFLGEKEAAQSNCSAHSCDATPPWGFGADLLTALK